MPKETAPSLFFFQATFLRSIFQKPSKGKKKDQKESTATTKTRWWFQIFLFSSLPGEGSHFDYYFSKGLKPPTTKIPATSENLFKDGIQKEYSGPSKGGTKPPENSPLGTVNKMKKSFK